MAATALDFTARYSGARAPILRLHADYAAGIRRRVRRRSSIRVEMDPAVGKGFYEVVSLSRGVELYLADLSFHDDRRVRIVGENQVKVYFKVAGQKEIVRPDRQVLTMRGPQAAMLMQPKGTDLDQWIPGQSMQRSVMIAGEPEALMELLQIDEGSLPGWIADSFLRSMPEFGYMQLPMNFDMQQAALAVLNPPFVGAHGALYREAKAYELMCMFLAAVRHQRDSPPVRLRPHDIEALHEARRILAENLEAPPTSCELARRVGINTNKLAQGFKYLFDETVFGFQHRHRMDHAKRLLREQRMDIGQIANAVGYAHASTFSSAFRSFTGCSPKEFRQGCE